jgi:hypothetical protein
MTINIPNFFRYEIQEKGQKIGEICAPCKWVAKKSWELFGLTLIFPNAKVKFKGFNIQKKSKNF